MPASRTMETRTERVRHHLRRPLAHQRELITKTPVTHLKRQARQMVPTATFQLIGYRLNLPPASARVNIDVFSDEEGRLRGQWPIPNGNPQPIDAHIIFDSHMQVFPV